METNNTETCFAPYFVTFQKEQMLFTKKFILQFMFILFLLAMIYYGLKLQLIPVNYV